MGTLCGLAEANSSPFAREEPGKLQKKPKTFREKRNPVLLTSWGGWRQVDQRLKEAHQDSSKRNTTKETEAWEQ